MKYILNAFSIKMLNLEKHLVKFEKVTKKEINKIKHDKDCVNAIGHDNISKQLNIPTKRMDIQLESGDVAYIIRSNKNARRKHTTSEWEKPKTTQWIYQKITILS